MTAAHSQGPFHVAKKHPRKVCDSRGFTLAKFLLVTKGANFRISAEEAEANAQLFAAAPALLEALVMVRDADNDCRLDGLPTIPVAARHKIDSAISQGLGVNTPENLRLIKRTTPSSDDKNTGTNQAGYSRSDEEWFFDMDGKP